MPKRALWSPLYGVSVLTIVSLFGNLLRPPVTPVNLTYVSFAATAVCAVPFLLSERRPTRWISQDRAVFLLLACMIITAGVGVIQEYPLTRTFATSVGMLLVYILLRIAIQAKADVLLVVRAVVVGCAVYVFGSLLLFTFYPERATLLISDAEITIAETASISGSLRVTGVTANPNMFASVPLLVWPLALVLTRIETSLVLRLAAGLLAAGSVLAIGVSYSRSAWGGLAVSGIVMLIATGRLSCRKRNAVALLLSLAMIVAGVAAIAGVRPELDAGALGERASSMRSRGEYRSREEIWMHGLHVVLSNPLGVGVGNYVEASRYVASPFLWAGGRSPHNSLLATAVETTAMGAGALLAIIMFTFRASVTAQTNTSSKGDIQSLERAIAAGGAGFWVHCMFHSLHMQIVYWTLLACGASIAARRRS